MNGYRMKGEIEGKKKRKQKRKEGRKKGWEKGGSEREERKNGKREKERKRRVRNMGLPIFQDSDLSRFEKILGIDTNFREIFKTFKCIASIENHYPGSVALELKVHMNPGGSY